MRVTHIAKVFFIVFSQMLCSNLWGQNRSSTSAHGKITSETGEVLLGVNIAVKGTTIGTISDVNGTYHLKGIPSGSQKLVVSYIGYKSAEVPVQAKSGQNIEVNLKLTRESVGMAELQVFGKSKTRTVNEQAYAVTALSAKELMNSSAGAQQLLNRVSGVRVMEEGGMGSKVNFTLNGFSGDQVKFFMDGIPMDNFGSSMGLSDIPVSMIERIEVYKGVVPVWLGTDALGGAVDIITSRKSNILDVSYTYGSFNTHKASIIGAYTASNGFTARFNTFLNYSDNNYKVLAEITNAQGNVYDTMEVRRFHDGYKSGTAQVEMGVVGKKFADNLLFGVIVSGNEKEVQHGITMKTVYGGVMQNGSSQIGTVKYSKKNLLFDGFNLNFNGSVNHNKTQNIDTLRGVTFNWLGEKFYSTSSSGQTSNNGELGKRSFITINNNEVATQLNATYDIGQSSSLALNYAFTYSDRDVNDREDPDNVANKFPKSLNKHVLGLAYKFDLNKRWSTTVFGKYFYLISKTSKEVDFAMDTQRTVAVKNEGSNMGYGIASTYFITAPLQLKVSYEHTYRLPIPSEVFGDGLFIKPNPDLKPEGSDNVNVGLTYTTRIKKDHELALGGSFIYRSAKDLIYTIPKVASPETRYGNLSKTQVLGMEGNFQYQWKNTFTLSGNVTFQDITDQAKMIYNESYTGTGWQKNFFYGYRLPNKPYLFWSTRAGYSLPERWTNGARVSLNYQYSFVERYFLTWNRNEYIIPRQQSHDLEVVCSLKEGKYNLSAECRNLFDARLYDKYYLQKPGRAFYVKFRYSL